VVGKVRASRSDLSKRSAPARRPFCNHIGINVGIKVTRVLCGQSAMGQVSHDLRDRIAQVTKNGVGGLLRRNRQRDRATIHDWARRSAEGGIEALATENDLHPGGRLGRNPGGPTAEVLPM
jgi:hypothetical protein